MLTCFESRVANASQARLTIGDRGRTLPEATTHQMMKSASRRPELQLCSMGGCEFGGSMSRRADSAPMASLQQASIGAATTVADGCALPDWHRLCFHPRERLEAESPGGVPARPAHWGGALKISTTLSALVGPRRRARLPCREHKSAQTTAAAD